jgi:transcription-repair coupling factor (superfamily II helicase)
VREVTVAKGTIRVAPLELRTSQRIRLQRISRDAVYKEDVGQLVVPVRRGADPLEAVTVLLGELVPAEAPASVASAAP